MSLIGLLIVMVYLFARIGVYVNGKTIFEFADRLLRRQIVSYVFVTFLSSAV